MLSKANINFASKTGYLKRNEKCDVPLKCSQCGKEDDYHLNRLEAKPHLWYVLLMWLVSIVGALYLGNQFFESFWQGRNEVHPRAIGIVAIGYILPLGLGGFVAFMLSKSGDRFNVRLPE